jgi:hypothetical protein
LLLLALALALPLPGCAPKKPPVDPALLGRAGRTPVVLVPGITGSRLRHTETGRLVWGKARHLFAPHDGGYAVALPVERPESWNDPIQPAGAIPAVKPLGLIRYEVYGPLLRTLKANGYRLGDLDAPRPGDTFFVFDYDWRYGNERAAAELARAMDRLRIAHGGPALEVDFICQSNAGRLLRWYLKYGDGSLEQAEAGRAAPPAGIRPRQVILVGAENGGALQTLATLNRGRRYFPLIGRKVQPETMFSFDSLFEALPGYRADLFFDEQGQALDVDLFDAESWRRYGWSVFAGKTAARLDKRGRSDLFGDGPARLHRLRRALDRSRRTHRMLRRDVEGFGDPRYHYIQSTDHPTGQRALLIPTEDGNRWKTVFSGEGVLKRDSRLGSLATTSGDGYATAESQQWVSPQERDAATGPPFLVPARHRQIIRHPETLRRIVEILAGP